MSGKLTNERVLLVGLGGFNRGDDALCACLLSSMRRVNGTRRIVVTVQRRGITRSNDSATELLLQKRSIGYHVNLIREILKADLVVIGGGSIIQDEFGATWIKGVMSIFAEAVLFAKLFRRTIITAPIGVDDLRTERGKRIATFVLSACSQIHVRDLRSLTNAERLLPGHPSIRLAADPAFAYPDFTVTQNPHLLVVCPAFEGVNEDVLMSINVGVIEAYLGTNTGRRCVILAMDERTVEDGGWGRQLLERIDKVLSPRVSFVIPGSHTEAARIIRSAHLLFAMRLHAMILALGYVPVYCLSRGVKTDTLAESLGIDFTSLRTLKASNEAVASFVRFTTRVEKPAERRRIVAGNQAARESARKMYERFELALP